MNNPDCILTQDELRALAVQTVGWWNEHAEHEGEKTLSDVPEEVYGCHGFQYITCGCGSIAVQEKDDADVAS